MRAGLGHAAELGPRSTEADTGLCGSFLLEFHHRGRAHGPSTSRKAFAARITPLPGQLACAMPSLALSSEYVASYFPQSYQVPASGVLHFTASDLAHALFTTGRAPGDTAAHGDASWWEFVHRASLVPAYLRAGSTGRIYRSDLALSLDRSEKVALSYYTGQAMTALFCRKILNVAYLLHLDRYGSRFGVAFRQTNQRPDLIGWDPSGGWVVAESKGRSNGMESALPAKIRSQKGSVRLINGQAPAISLGCVAMFPSSGYQDGRLRLHAIDPPPSESAPDFEIDSNDYYRAYYDPWVAAIRQGQPEYDGVYIVSEFAGLRLRIGMLRALYDALTGERQGTVDLSEVIGGSGVASGVRESAFRDGTKIEADWDDDISRGSEANVVW